MSREIPFNEKAKCDTCGKFGAFEVMGDYFCEKCMKDFTQEDKWTTIKTEELASLRAALDEAKALFVEAQYSISPLNPFADKITAWMEKYGKVEKQERRDEWRIKD